MNIGSSLYKREPSRLSNHSTAFISHYVTLAMASTIYIGKMPDSVTDIILDYINFFEPGSEPFENALKIIQDIKEGSGSNISFPFNQTSTVVLLGGDLWKKHAAKLVTVNLQPSDNSVRLRLEYFSIALLTACIGFTVITALVTFMEIKRKKSSLSELK